MLLDSRVSPSRKRSVPRAVHYLISLNTSIDSRSAINDHDVTFTMTRSSDFRNADESMPTFLFKYLC